MVNERLARSGKNAVRGKSRHFEECRAFFSSKRRRARFESIGSTFHRPDAEPSSHLSVPFAKKLNPARKSPEPIGWSKRQIEAGSLISSGGSRDWLHRCNSRFNSFGSNPAFGQNRRSCGNVDRGQPLVGSGGGAYCAQGFPQAGH